MERTKETLEWHWNDPLYPAYREGSGSGRTPAEKERSRALAELMTERQCPYCWRKYVGDIDGHGIAHHITVEHPGRPQQYYIYPPVIGIRPKGYG